MKKFLIITSLAFAIQAHAQLPKPETCPGMGCCQVAQCDSINIPVFLVDGVEVQNIDEINPDDILKLDIIKDHEVTRIFTPRLLSILRKMEL